MFISLPLRQRPSFTWMDQRLCLGNPPGAEGHWTQICQPPFPRDRAQQSGRFDPAENRLFRKQTKQLFQKRVDNNLLRFLFRKPQRLKLQHLLVVNPANRRLVDDRGVGVVGLDRGSTGRGPHPSGWCRTGYGRGRGRCPGRSGGTSGSSGPSRPTGR